MERHEDIEPREVAAADQPRVLVDEEFKRLIPPLSPPERQGLEDSLLAQGCREPLAVWAGHGKLLDGHNRYRICKRHGLPYRTAEIDLPDAAAARDWILRNQLGRRNLGPKRMAYIRGKLYESRKAPGKKSGPSADKARRRAAEELAAEFRVEERTIRRDAELAKQIDLIVKRCGEDAWATLLAERTRLTNADFKRLSEMPAAEQRKAMKHVAEEGRLPRAAGRKPNPTPLDRLLAAWRRADEAARLEFAADPDVAEVLRGLGLQPVELTA